METLLLFINVINCFEFSELHQLWINLSGRCYLCELLLKDFHERESTLFGHFNAVSLLHEGHVLELCGSHDEAETLSSTCNACCAAHSVDILLDLAGEIPLEHPVDALEVETP